MKFASLLVLVLCPLASAEVIVRPAQLLDDRSLQIGVLTQIAAFVTGAPVSIAETITRESSWLIHGPAADAEVRVLFGDMFSGFIRREFDNMGLPNASVVTSIRVEIPEIGYRVTDVHAINTVPLIDPHVTFDRLPTNTPLTFRVTNSVLFNSGTPNYSGASFRGGLMNVIRVVPSAGITFSPASQSVPEPATLSMFAITVALLASGACTKSSPASWFRRPRRLMRA